jgi:Protein of unknown function (DUF3738)
MKISDPKANRGARADPTAVKFTRVPVSSVAWFLNQFYNLSVVDKTGLTDDYDYSLPILAITQHSAQNEAATRAAVNAMLKDLGLGLAPERRPGEVLVVKKAAPPPISADKHEMSIGPLNPGAEEGIQHWYPGIDGDAWLLTDSTDPANGDNDFTLENSSTDRHDHADWRSEVFPLGTATNGARPLRFSFDYKLPDPVKDGDNLRVQLRFYDQTTNFIGQKEFWVGANTHDSAMTKYKTMVAGDIVSPPDARLFDIVLSANLYDDRWSSGAGRFDNVLVTIPDDGRSSPDHTDSQKSD